MGSISPLGGIKVADIGVATIEKANGIVNRYNNRMYAIKLIYVIIIFINIIMNDLHLN